MIVKLKISYLIHHLFCVFRISSLHNRYLYYLGPKCPLHKCRGLLLTYSGHIWQAPSWGTQLLCAGSTGARATLASSFPCWYLRLQIMSTRNTCRHWIFSPASHKPPLRFYFHLGWKFSSHFVNSCKQDITTRSNYWMLGLWAWALSGSHCPTALLDRWELRIPMFHTEAGFCAAVYRNDLEPAGCSDHVSCSPWPLRNRHCHPEEGSRQPWPFQKDEDHHWNLRKWRAKGAIPVFCKCPTLAVWCWRYFWNQCHEMHRCIWFLNPNQFRWEITTTKLSDMADQTSINRLRKKNLPKYFSNLHG